MKILILILTFGAAIGLSLNCEAVATECGAESSGAAVQQRDSITKLDPAAWGSDHVGKAVPEFVRGDECLFCHRNDIGASWQTNAHAITLRQREDAPELKGILGSQPALATLAKDIDYFLGSRHRVRFLRKSGYGKFSLLSSQVILSQDSRAHGWIGLEQPTWDNERFGDRCAGCHTTAVESRSKTFALYSLDCSTCHGDVNLEHTKDTALVFLSKKRRNEARVITSACASCHLRGGKSRSTSLPYPNNFVAGDNLFKDFQPDFSKAADEKLNAGDRHIYRSVRDVAVNGTEFPTCISCHSVHEKSSFKHRRAPRTAICADCHNVEGSIKGSTPYIVHSATCEY